MNKRIIAVANQKGGVGKTTTTVNLAAALAVTGNKVLLVDLDPQGNATMACGINKMEVQMGVGNLLLGQAEVKDVVHNCESNNLKLIPSNQSTIRAEIDLLGMENREFKLKQALDELEEFDYILIDCPPSLNMLTVNALVSAHGVLVPMQCEYYALEGLSALAQTVQTINQSTNTELSIYGILRTMYDGRNNLTNEESNQLVKHFGDKLFNTVIPRNVRLAEAPSFGKSVIAHDPGSKGAQAYLALAGEVLRRDGKSIEVL